MTGRAFIRSCYAVSPLVARRLENAGRNAAAAIAGVETRTYVWYNVDIRSSEKVHYAAHGYTAAEIFFEQADAEKSYRTKQTDY